MVKTIDQLDRDNREKRKWLCERVKSLRKDRVINDLIWMHCGFELESSRIARDALKGWRDADKMVQFWKTECEYQRKSSKIPF